MVSQASQFWRSMAHDNHCSPFTPQTYAGELLQPDDVTFSVLMRGYGEMNPPSWVLISGLLKMMEKQFQMKPSLGKLCLSIVSSTKLLLTSFGKAYIMVSRFNLLSGPACIASHYVAKCAQMRACLAQ